jgi:hypothetical protein
MKLSTCNAILTTLMIMLSGVVQGQQDCESEDGREGFCVDTTDPDSVAVCTDAVTNARGVSRD